MKMNGNVINEEKLDRSIDSVTKKQINMIKEWEEKHPNWNNLKVGLMNI